MKFKIVPTENFAELRQRGGYYVDKTGYLEKLLNECPEATLFTRPRRFGKSLFMNMLAEFLDIKKQGTGKSLFEGLAISSNDKLCQEWMHQYPVIYLTLKGINSLTFVDALKRIELFVSHICNDNYELMNSSAITTDDQNFLKMLSSMKANTAVLSNALFILTRVMYRHYGRKVILLIDEYDVPVAKAAEKGYYDQMIDFMRNFLSDALKSNPYLQFAILTGALRITKESMFSGLNNLECFDISSTRYSDTFGFTQDEVDKMLADFGCEEKRDIIKDWYDGYHFGKRQDIYCPWSITNYLADLKIKPMEPKAYWTNTSGNELTKGFVDHVPENVQDQMASLLAGNSIDVHLNEELDYTELYRNTNNFWTFLYLTGYLTTISDSTKSSFSSSHIPKTLAVPNKDVLKAFENDIVSWFVNILPAEQQTDFFKKFWDWDAQGLHNLLTERMLSSASVRDYQYGEHFYRAMLLGIFLLIGFEVRFNREAGIGFPDLQVVDTRKKLAAVIELKVAETENELEERVLDALKQISIRKYDAPLRNKGYTVYRWGMAFYKKMCRMAVLRM